MILTENTIRCRIEDARYARYARGVKISDKDLIRAVMQALSEEAERGVLPMTIGKMGAHINDVRELLPRVLGR